MAIDPSFRNYVTDLLADLGPVEIKAMFGGGGVYLDGMMFGLMADESLFLKVDDQTEARFAQAGSQPFVFRMKDGRSATMRYWRLPDEAGDDRAAAGMWARLAFEAAMRAKSAKARSRVKVARAPRLLIDGPWDED
jgi:DNA transformation protein